MAKERTESMSYDIRFGVKVADADGLIVRIGSPEYDSPTYNIGTMHRKCMDWDFKQGVWYKVVDVLPNIERGLHEITFNEKAYTKYNAENGWGTTQSARECLKSVLLEIEHYHDGWNQEIPLEHLYMEW